MKTKSHSQKEQERKVGLATLGSANLIPSDKPIKSEDKSRHSESRCTAEAKSNLIGVDLSSDICQENPYTREEGVKTGMKPTKLTFPEELEVVPQSPDISKQDETMGSTGDKQMDKYMDNLIKYGNFGSKAKCPNCHKELKQLKGKHKFAVNIPSKSDISKEQEIPNVSDNVIWFDKGYKQGRKDYETDLMIKGKFHTSMNRKVCFDIGYKRGLEKGRKDAIEEFIEKLKEELLEEGKRIFATGQGKYKSMNECIDKIKKELQ